MPWTNAPADGSAESEASRRHRGPSATELATTPAKDPYPLGAPQPEPETVVLQSPKERKAAAAALKAARQRAEKAAKTAQKEALKAHKQALKAHKKLQDGTEPPPQPSDDLSAFMPPDEACELKSLGWVMGPGGTWEEAAPDSARSSNASSTASRRRQEWATGMPELDASAILPTAGGDAGGEEAIVDREEAERLGALQAENEALEAELRAGVVTCREAGDAALAAGDFIGAVAAYRSGLELKPEDEELTAAIATVEVKRGEAAAREELRASGSLVVGELVLDGLWKSSVEGALIAVRPRALTAPFAEAQFLASGTTYPLREHDGVCSMGDWTLSLDRSDESRLLWEKDRPEHEEPEPEPEPQPEVADLESAQPNWSAHESEANESLMSDASNGSSASVYVDPHHLSYGSTIISEASAISENSVLSDDDDVDPHEPQTPEEVARRRHRGRHVAGIENNAPVIPPDGDWDLAGRFRWNLTGPNGEKVALDSIANSERKGASVVDWLEDKGYGKRVAKIQEQWTGESQLEAHQHLEVAKTESSMHASGQNFPASMVDVSGAEREEQDDSEVDPLAGDITWEFLGRLESGSHFPDAIAAAFVPPPKKKMFSKAPPPSTVERLHLNGCGIDDEACASLMELLPKLTSLTYIDLRDNPINSETKVQLAAVVAKCPGLRADWTADVSTTVLLQSPKDKVDPHNRYYRVEGEAEEVVRPINLSFQVHKTQPRYLEPTTKSEWLKERNKVLPTKILTKKDDPEHVGTIVKDHESAEISIPLDFGEDWSNFWPKLEKLGWVHEDDPNCSFEHHFYIPPGVDIHTEEAEGLQLRVDYFDTKKQVRDYVQRKAAEAKAAKDCAKRNRKNKKSAEPA